jgi:hypothetical protein
MGDFAFDGDSSFADMSSSGFDTSGMDWNQTMGMDFGQGVAAPPSLQIQQMQAAMNSMQMEPEIEMSTTNPTC